MMKEDKIDSEYKKAVSKIDEIMSNSTKQMKMESYKIKAEILIAHVFSKQK